MSTSKVLTLLLVIFAALTYIDNHEKLAKRVSYSLKNIKNFLAIKSMKG